MISNKVVFFFKQAMTIQPIRLFALSQQSRNHFVKNKKGEWNGLQFKASVMNLRLRHL